MTEAGAQTPAPPPVVGRAVSRRTRMLVLAAAVLYLVAAVLSRRPTTIVLAAGYLVLGGLVMVRPPVRVDRDGVQNPRLGRRPQRIPWSRIDAVERTDRFATTVTLLMVDGSRLELAGLPAGRASDIATLGGKPLRPAIQPAMAGSGAAAVPRSPTPAEEQRQLDQRVGALTRQRANMAAELARVRPSPSPPPARGPSS